MKLPAQLVPAEFAVILAESLHLSSQWSFRLDCPTIKASQCFTQLCLRSFHKQESGPIFIQDVQPRIVAVSLRLAVPGACLS